VAERLFPESQPLIVHRPGKVSKRTQAQRAAEIRRLGSMHNRHGHGPEGQQCGACAHIVRRSWDGRKTFLKCELYNSKGYEGTDWRARWPACGQFTRRAP